MKVKNFLQDVTGASRVTKARLKAFADASPSLTDVDPIGDVARTWHPGPMELVITQIRETGRTAKTIRFARPDGKKLPPFYAGQYLVLTLPIGSSIVSRPYSISSAPWEARQEKDPFVEITVRRSRGDGFVCDYINEELKSYKADLEHKPQIIAANKLDILPEEEAQQIADRLRKEFEPQGYTVMPISAVTGKGVKELLYKIREMLNNLDEEPIVFQPEYIPQKETVEEPFEVYRDPDEERTFVVEGPRIERMLGYTNLESEKGFAFFQKFLKENGILKMLEQLGIRDGDTVRMYGHEFDYYK